MSDRSWPVQMFTDGLEAYADAHTSSPPELLQEIERETVKGRSAIMLADRVVGRLLGILAATLRPSLAVDVGTFTGYSALSIAEGLAPGGKVITCEVDPKRAVIADAYFQRSPLRDRIELRVGPALEVLRSIEQPIGLAFIDADKKEYWAYYDALIERLSPSGIIVVDNTLFLGIVLLADAEESKLPSMLRSSRATLIEFNRRLQADPRSESCLLTASDGVTIIRRR